MTSRRAVPAAALALALAVALAPAVGAAGTTPSAAADRARVQIEVTGVGVTTWPAFDPQVERYAIDTASDTGGAVTVRASTTDPTARITVDGLPLRGGERTVDGLEPGDEVAVLVDGDRGSAVHSFLYLPPQFPVLERDTDGPSLDTPSPGHVLLTLGLWTEPSPFFETAVDANGVPAFVVSTANSMDLKPAPGGHYSVARGRAEGGADVVELDEQLREVGRYRTVGLQHTDGHDAILEEDGTRYLLAYEPNTRTGLTDAVVQHVAADGSVLFEWNSADHVDVEAETVVGVDDPDYAHINSVEVMQDGDLLLSFRHLSSVLKVARTAHDGFAAGEVVWRLGGRASDFTVRDPDGSPDGGPCAQHTAHELPNGDIQVFDNGAWSLNPLCIDPADPAGDTVARTPTRIAQFRLDETDGSATVVEEQVVGDRYAIFAGSVQPLDGDRSMIGWASSTEAVASELGPGGELLWDLRATERPRYFSYRAHKAPVPDATPPDVMTPMPADGATYTVGDRVVPRARCTDRGGSSLHACEVSAVDTTTPGRRVVTFTATDGAGNTTVVQRDYDVVAPGDRPDALIGFSRRTLVGDDVYGGPARQSVTGPLRRAGRTVQVRVENDGSAPSRFVLATTGPSRDFRLALSYPDGRRRSPVLAPGGTWTVGVTVEPRRSARRGDLAVVRLAARAVDGSTVDTVRARLRLR